MVAVELNPLVEHIFSCLYRPPTTHRCPVKASHIPLKKAGDERGNIKAGCKVHGKVPYHASRSVVGHLLGACKCNAPGESRLNVIILQQGFSSEPHKRGQEVTCIPGPATVRVQQSTNALVKGYQE